MSAIGHKFCSANAAAAAVREVNSSMTRAYIKTATAHAMESALNMPSMLTPFVAAPCNQKVMPMPIDTPPSVPNGFPNAGFFGPCGASNPVVQIPQGGAGNSVVALPQGGGAGMPLLHPVPSQIQVMSKPGSGYGGDAWTPLHQALPQPVPVMAQVTPRLPEDENRGNAGTPVLQPVLQSVPQPVPVMEQVTPRMPWTVLQPVLQPVPQPVPMMSQVTSSHQSQAMVPELATYTNIGADGGMQELVRDIHNDLSGPEASHPQRQLRVRRWSIQ